MSLDESVFEEIFEKDGSYRDIYIHQVNILDWEKMANVLNRSDAKLRFLRDDKKLNLQSYSIKRIFEDKKDYSFLLTIEFDGININTHFFEEHVIEFDINPNEINTTRDRHAVFQFMNYLAKALHKNVSITPENCPQLPYAIVYPNETISVGI